MKVCVLTREGWESATCLAARLGIPTVRVASVAERYDLVIRYGNRDHVETRVLNSSEAVRVCVNRAVFAEKMTKAGVRNPYIYGWWKKIKWWNKYPRYLYSVNGSQQGAGIIIVQSEEDKKWLEKLGWSWSAESVWIPVRNEWRVHVIWDGEIYRVLVQKKVPRDVSQFMFLVRNVAMHGYKFKIVPREEWQRDIVIEAMKAFRVVGLDFGAIDVIEDMNGKAWVVDVNSAPGIVRVRRVFEFYCEWLKRRLMNEGWGGESD